MSEAIIKNLNIPILNSNNKELKENLASKKISVNKTSKPFRFLTKDLAIDNVFNELETTYDNDGKIVDTRFSPEIQNYIREYLKEKNIEFNDLGYQSLRNACYGLNTKDRLELCNKINYKYDKNIDIDERLHGTGFFEGIKNKLAIAGGGLALGAAVGGAAQAFAPNKLADSLRGPVQDQANKMLKEELPLVSGALKEPVNKFINDNILSKTLPINLGIFSAAGLISGVAGSVVTGLYSFAKKTVNRVKDNIKYKEFLKLDNELYENDNLLEAQKYEALLTTESCYQKPYEEELGKTR